jgi:hypothetical protein
MTEIVLRLPPCEVDDYTAAIVVGSPEAEFGEKVTVTLGEESDSMWVAGVDCAPLNALHEEIPLLFRETSLGALWDRLCRVYGTGLPNTVPVTLYTLVSAPPETWEFSE